MSRTILIGKWTLCGLLIGRDSSPPKIWVFVLEFIGGDFSLYSVKPVVFLLQVQGVPETYLKKTTVPKMDVV